MQRFGRDGQFHVLPQPTAGAEPLASLDPRMVYAVCRFSLGDGPVRIRASLPDDFWSVAIFDRRGRNVYSLNDRSAERTQLDLAILTPVQMAQLRAGSAGLAGDGDRRRAADRGRIRAAPGVRRRRFAAGAGHGGAGQRRLRREL